jgi:uncharacterized protein YjbJ (UPF0337 family)
VSQPLGLFRQGYGQRENQDFMGQSDTPLFKGKWKLQLRAARIAWARLTEDELLASEGRMDSLISLVQERYALSGEEATRRVTNFMAMRDC